MRPVADAIGDLKLPYILYDGRDLLLRHLELRRHVTVRPMVLSYAEFGRQKERSIGVMSRVVDVVDQRRAFVGASGLEAMAGGAVCFERVLSNARDRRKLRFHNVDRPHPRRKCWLQELPSYCTEARGQHRKYKVFREAICEAHVA